MWTIFADIDWVAVTSAIGGIAAILGIPAGAKVLWDRYEKSEAKRLAAEEAQEKKIQDLYDKLAEEKRKENETILAMVIENTTLKARIAELERELERQRGHGL